MMGMKYCIQTKYFGPTNTKGARIKARCLWGSVVVSYDYGARDPHFEAVKALCRKLFRPEGMFMLAAEELAGPDGGTLYVVDMAPEQFKSGCLQAVARGRERRAAA